MREILFKAKRIDNGKWVQGYLFKIWERAYILWGTTNDVPNMIEVDSNTICQYTGLTDKNGNKIWENDIVTCCEKRGYAFSHCLVLWNQRKARFDVRAMNCNFPMTLDGCVDDISINGLDYEVIGNIFDNADLVKE